VSVAGSDGSGVGEGGSCVLKTLGCCAFQGETCIGCGAKWVRFVSPSAVEAACATCGPTFEALEATWPEDAFEVLQLQGAQERLNLGEEPTVGGTRGRLVAVGQGFSLHAGTAVHENDRDSLLFPIWLVDGTGARSRSSYLPGRFVAVDRLAIIKVDLSVTPFLM